MNTIHRTGEISGFRSEIVTVDGIRVHYWRGGDAGGQPVLTLTRPFGGDVAEAEPLPYRKPPAHELKGGQGRSGVSIRAGPQRARGCCGCCRMTLRHFKLPGGTDFAIPVDWWDAAGMEEFKCTSESYYFLCEP
jgi:hypothetical protein